jgi:NADH-quinone oxidoreductase subunit L
MTVPLVILAIPAFFSGYSWAAIFGVTWLERFFELPGVHEADASVALTVTVMATAAGLTGLFIGWLLYAVVKPETRAKWIQAGKPIYTLVRNKYYVDEAYDFVFVQGTLGASKVIAWFDGNVVDGIVNFVGTVGVAFAEASGWFDREVVDRLVTMWADISRYLASVFRRVSTGYVQQYMLTFVVVIVASVLLFQVIR